MFWRLPSKFLKVCLNSVRYLPYLCDDEVLFTLLTLHWPLENPFFAGVEVTVTSPKKYAKLGHIFVKQLNCCKSYQGAWKNPAQFCFVV
jgi:hypothetical protein